MADLIVRGKDPGQEWRKALPPGPITLGRSGECTWAVPWDRQVSRVHAQLDWDGAQLRVRRLPTGKNHIFYLGRACDEFALGPGGQFVIGETVFTLLGDEDPPEPEDELTCNVEELRQIRYVDADERIDVLGSLPEVIRGSASPQEQEERVAEALLRGIKRAAVAAVVRVPVGPLRPVPPSPDGPLPPSTWRGPVEIRALRSRAGMESLGASTFQPSRRLIVDTVRRRKQGVVHLWQGGKSGSDYTNMAGLDWALCVPVPDASCPGWCVYVAGQAPERLVAEGRSPLETHLKSDLKFAEVVADIFGSLRHLCDLQRREGELARFLSKSVREALVGHDLADVLQAREAEVTVLFCDLRGSCQLHEQGEHELPGLWERISRVLAVMSGAIIAEDGVIGDFLGDAVLGFWGWPLPQPDQVERAARAALAIRGQFEDAKRDPRDTLARLACGIGIAHGRAIVGRLGTSDQYKVDVFGPVVNLASRLESMTKAFGVPILLDEAAAGRLREAAAPPRVRRLAKVRPYGMTRAAAVSEVLPPADAEAGGGYEAALEAFEAGRWAESRERLLTLPPDGAVRFLIAHIDRHGSAPPQWDGVVVMLAK